MQSFLNAASNQTQQAYRLSPKLRVGLGLNNELLQQDSSTVHSALSDYVSFVLYFFSFTFLT